MKPETLDGLFVEELKDIYDAETKMTRALPKMVKAASSTALKKAFQEHLEKTESHLTRLDQIFRELEDDPGGKTCKGMAGLLAEGEEFLDPDLSSGVRDAGLIAAAQKVEHYEMATYGCLRDWARLLDMKDAAELLQQTLNEEGAANNTLTRIAHGLNVEAMVQDVGDDAKDGPSRPRSRPKPSKAAATRRLNGRRS